MNIQIRKDEVELLQSVTMLETPTTLVVISKEVKFTHKSNAIATRMRDQTMWFSTFIVVPTNEFVNIATCVMN